MEPTNLQDLLGKALAFQAKMEEVKGRLSTVLVTGEAGGGLVKATASANGDLRKIEIDESLFKSEDREFMEDLIVAAVNQALQEAKKRSEEEMSKIAQETIGVDPSEFLK